MKIAKYSSYVTLLLVGTFASSAIAQTTKPETEQIPENPPKLNLETESVDTLSPFVVGAEAPLTPLIAEDSVPSDSIPDTPPTTEETPTNPETEEKDTKTDTETNTFSVRGGIRYTTEGAGYEEGFTSFEGFLPLFQTPGKNLTFVEGRLLLQNNGDLGGNVVLGQRFFDESSHRVYGGYIAYDNRDTSKNSFNQLGVGFETLGENWDFRINGYLPIGDNRQLSSESFPSIFGFQGNALLLNRTRQFESAATGFDAEFGGKIARLGKGTLRGYGGVYYINAAGDDSALGVKGRLEIRPTDNLNLNLSIQNDRIFDTRVVASLGITFPGTSARGNNEDKPKGLDRMGETVARQHAILVLQQTEQDKVAAVNPETNQPWRFQHVILGKNEGNGTFESPFGNVQNGLDATVSDGDDIVYVQPGDGSEIPPFEIPDRVQVLSTAPVQKLDTKQAGTVILPLSGSGQMPIIDPLVIMGNSTTISGFAIINAPDAAIVGEGIENVTIRDNLIVNSAEEGIRLEEVTGKVNIVNTTIDTTESGSGIFIDNSSGAVDLRINKTTITNPALNGIEINFSGTAEGIVNITDTQVLNSEFAGIVANLEGNSNSTITIDKNTASGGGLGIVILPSESSRSTVTISNNIVQGNLLDGIAIFSSDSSTSTANIFNNTASGNGLNGTSIFSFDSSQLTATIDNNTTDSNGFNGIFILPFDSSTSNVTISHNIVQGNLFDGIAIFSVDSSTSTANIFNNTASDNGLDGISNETGDNSLMRSLIQGNTTNNNGRFGIEISATDTSSLFAGVRLNNLIENPGELMPFLPFGFAAQTLDNSTLCVDLKDNTSSNGFLLNGVSGTFNANASGNNSDVSQSGVVNPLGTCPVP
ncbi:right-handed parallel beta-helix repeat-containing protein [Limnofasciculus baicalensis]|uniref:Right-handed parallel beta-helix repeat-containing protein n=1 Tax=Limnofasciculus baicalensis BBK-W-15 TaxID=2699891 RepID=A0AAE3GXL4_9CYAN|nr:right-handed parallel beta-helix repeat-containing protein [Limnofasciculus baicalensis]MCP2731703.1 right-handed parallel beta-helix repeat-containing protein [Limnofasciculus baicalensis BBK-W-15]